MSGSADGSAGFEMREVFDDPAVVRLVLSGELDFAVAEVLGNRLRMLRNAGHDVRVDLAELEFIDLSGLRELIAALAEADSEGWRLEIDPHSTPLVRRAVELAGLQSLFGTQAGPGLPPPSRGFVESPALRRLRDSRERRDEEVCRLIAQAVLAGVRSQDIAEALGISRSTLWRHYRNELRLRDPS
jgi:anti-anti-sigma factor